MLDEDTANDIARRVSEAMRTKEIEAPKPSIDWTINMGHILTAFSLLIVIVGIAINIRILIADQDSRIKTLEAERIEDRQMMRSVADSLSQIQITSHEQAMTLQYIQKQITK